MWSTTMNSRTHQKSRSSCSGNVWPTQDQRSSSPQHKITMHANLHIKPFVLTLSLYLLSMLSQADQLCHTRCHFIHTYHRVYCIIWYQMDRYRYYNCGWNILSSSLQLTGKKCQQCPLLVPKERNVRADTCVNLDCWYCTLILSWFLASFLGKSVHVSDHQLIHHQCTRASSNQYDAFTITVRVHLSTKQFQCCIFMIACSVP